MMNVVSKFSDEPATWTNYGLSLLFLSYICDGPSTNRGTMARIPFLHRP